uniref:Reverse transcriptase domain-containing protein n=1 Tax=Anabas testudineus TaxID=64144 RepID=A0AAQ6IFP3_ANATE
MCFVLVLLDLSAAFEIEDHHILLEDFCPLKYEVPQVSVLGPISFSLYMLLLGPIICKCGVSFYCYADDTQLYSEHERRSSLHACINKIKSCLQRDPLVEVFCVSLMSELKLEVTAFVLGAPKPWNDLP